jgi:hypothetical protein
VSNDYPDNDDSSSDGDRDTDSDSDEMSIPDGLVLRGHDSNRYHTDGSCDRIPDNHVTMRTAVADSWDTMTECAICAETWAPSGTDKLLCKQCGGSGGRWVPNVDYRLCVACSDHVDLLNAQSRRK